VAQGRLLGRQALADAGIAACFAVCLVIGSISAAALQVDELDAPAFALIVLAAFACLGLRRIAPLWALVSTMIIVSGYLLAGYPYGPVQLCMVVAMFEVARQLPMRISSVACGLAAIAASGTVLVRLVHEDVHFPLLVATAWTGWIVLPWSLGTLARVVAAARERARRDLVAAAALDERARMAGEVHDVAGHGFAVVAMQAGVALQVLDDDPDQVRASLAAIKATSSAALAELRGMLDTLHPDEPDDRGLADVPKLVDQLREGGLTVELDVESGEPAPVKQVDAAAYRVVQESLTNVLRHAETSSAEVRVRRAASELVVHVRDHGHAASPAGPPGRGLTGMRKRVEALGGHLDAGPHDDGGFAVTAHLPLDGRSG
jgi:signal transduction histidine kinase